MLSDKRIKKITSLQRKVILGFLKGRDTVCESPDGLRQIFNFCLVTRGLCQQGNHSIHRWPDISPQIAFSSKRKVLNCSKTSSSIKPNKFLSKYVCFDSRKTREERKICLKIRLFGFPQRLAMESATMAARKVVLSSTPFGPFKI